MRIRSYDLDLDVDFRKARLRGKVTVNVEKGSRPFVLDALDMKVLSASVDGRTARFKHDSKKGRLTIEGVPQRESSVTVTYSKEVSDDVIFGLYKSRYGKDYMLVTDLEPAEARTVFPCVDNPASKAVFSLSITTESGLDAISNTRVASRTPLGSRTRFEFEPTPRMSTYLLFFGVGRFEEASRRAGKKIVTVACRPGESKDAEFILGEATSVLRHYERYYDVPYPLSKLHLVALPEYHTGAMENWGAITSREAYVLVGPGTSASDTQGAAIVMAHEIAHQWFGDLVTMKWWDDLWLNESFATFMECKALDALHPDWDAWAFLLRSQTFRSMVTDSLSSTHPIHVAVRTPAEAGQVFDAISYGKGASVLRMIESFVGSEGFRKGVSSYLKKFSYSNAAGKDLWMSIQNASGKPVSRIMSQWVTKPGFPVVRVRYRDGKLGFSQTGFRLDGSEKKSVWPIPLTYQVNGKPEALLFDKAASAVSAPNLRTLSVNIGHAGYYSVLYSDELYDMIARDFAGLSQYEKGGMMNDLFLFLLAGKVSPKAYFRFASLCSREKSPFVVETVTDQFSLLFALAGEIPQVRKQVTAFVVAQSERLGFKSREGEEPHDKVAREAVVSLLARLDTKYTKILAEEYRHLDAVDPDVKEAVAIAYARSKGDSVFDELVRLVKSTTSEIDRGRLYAALTSFKDPSLVERALELGVSGEVSRSDSAYTMNRAAANPDARDMLWAWMKKRYERLWTIYSGSQQIILYYEAIVPRCAVGKEDDVRRFFDKPRIKQGGLAFERIIESVGIRTRLRKELLQM